MDVLYLPNETKWKKKRFDQIVILTTSLPVNFYKIQSNIQWSISLSILQYSKNNKCSRFPFEINFSRPKSKSHVDTREWRRERATLQLNTLCTKSVYSINYLVLYVHNTFWAKCIRIHNEQHLNRLYFTILT